MIGAESGISKVDDEHGQPSEMGGGQESGLIMEMNVNMGPNVTADTAVGKAGSFAPQSPLMETEPDSTLPISLDALEAAVLDYQGTVDSPCSSSGNPSGNPEPTPNPNKRSRGRPKGSLNKSHVPAWQTKENRRIRQKERRELYRLQQAEESERRRREDPSYVSPKRRVGRPRKVREGLGMGMDMDMGMGVAMGELLAGAGVTEDGVRLSLMEEQQQEHASGQQMLDPHIHAHEQTLHHHEHDRGRGVHDHQEESHTHGHEGVDVGMDLDMSTGMGLDMAAMGLDFQSDPAEFAHAHLSHDHHDDHQHQHQHLGHDQQSEHDHLHHDHHDLHHHHHHDPHDTSDPMHTDDHGVLQMLDMPAGLDDMTVGVDEEEETNYLAYGAETYAYTLDAIERAHAAVRAEEERNGMQ
jgi:hypothetical protein